LDTLRSIRFSAGLDKLATIGKIFFTILVLPFHRLCAFQSYKYTIVVIFRLHSAKNRDTSSSRQYGNALLGVRH